MTKIKLIYLFELLSISSLIHSFQFINTLKVPNLHLYSFKSDITQEKLNRNFNIYNDNIPQVLTFNEPLTNVTVVLIGSMHYNPASIS